MQQVSLTDFAQKGVDRNHTDWTKNRWKTAKSVETKRHIALEKKYLGSETTPYINQGKRDTLARRAMSLLHHVT